MNPRPLLALFVLTSLLGSPANAQFDHEHLRYDAPNETIEAAVLTFANLYDADIASVDDQLWITCLEFEPGKGDTLWLHRLENKACQDSELLLTEQRMMARPTFFRARHKDLVIAFEDTRTTATSSYPIWNIGLVKAGLGGTSKRTSVRSSPSSCINHSMASHGNGRAYVVWQQQHGGVFNIGVRDCHGQFYSSAHYALLKDKDFREPTIIGDSSSSCWKPDVAALPDGTVCVVYDAYNGDSYNVHAWISKDGESGKTVSLAATPAFEGRTRVAADSKGRFWVVWEEGAANWGKRYVTRMRLKGEDYFEMTDDNGPLHRFRRLRVAVIDTNGTVKRLKDPLPMPSFDLARKRPKSPEGSKQLGVFYERATIAVDASDKVWIVYRHYYVPYLGCEWITHNQSPWAVYARCLTSNGWSKLYRFDVGQGDGMQRLEITPHGQDGIAAVWTTGRTHRAGREPTNLPRGIAVATIALEGNAPGDDLLTESTGHERFGKLSKPPSPPPRKAVVGDTEYELVFGDLHRHTDLSLCFVPADGTMDDHYRYAIDVVKHDFMGITDHARDIANGDALSQLWWRCTKEVSRHDLGSRFIPFSAYERSRGGEDHNVITLGIAPLKPHTYPHADFWKELDDKTITIPHQTRTAEITDPDNPPWSISANTWKVRDDVHRPLIEVYQACRDRWIGVDAHEGLRQGHHLGFIASSDHLATSSSYACVWTPERTREAIFQAMKARRTFAATDKIRLILRAGDHWMGEQFDAPSMPRIDLEVDGTATLQSIEIIVDGKVEQRLPQSRQKVKLTYQPVVTEPGEHWVYVRAIQEDGNQAWSSPLFVTIQK